MRDENNRLVQTFPDSIKDSDLPDLDVRLTRPVAVGIARYFMRVLPKIGMTYKDLLLLFQIKNNDLTEEENIEFQKRTDNFLGKLLVFWISDCHDSTGKPNADIKDVFKFIAEATQQDIELIENTELTILAEIFKRIFLQPINDLKNANFIMLMISLLMRCLVTSNTTKTES